MEENLKLVEDIMSKAIKITLKQKQDVSFEFHPLTNALVITIYFNGKCNNNGLIKSWGVDVKELECLNEVLKNLTDIDETTDTIIVDDFLG